MDVLPVDFVALVSVIMGISVVLIPVAGLTARFAFKPIVDALGRYFDRQAATESAKIVERRLELLESQIDDLQSSMARLLEVSEFDARLKSASNQRVLAQRTGDSAQD